jgi:hypothetical protein
MEITDRAIRLSELVVPLAVYVAIVEPKCSIKFYWR